MAGYLIQKQPEDEPLTLEEVKEYLRVDTDSEDDLITSFIIAARRQVEARTYRPLITQSWLLSLDFSEISDIVEINKFPLQTVDSIKYFDIDGNIQTIDSSKYIVDKNSNPCRVQFIDLPSTIKNQINAMQIKFTCGYGDLASDVPDDIKLAMKFIIGHYYENRQDVVTGTQVNEIPQSSQFLLEPYRNNVFGW